MRFIKALVAVAAILALAPAEAQASKGSGSHGPSRGRSSGDVFVRGYPRANGTFVRPHMRSRPDGNVFNNWSTWGNVNPYTGKFGSVDPFQVLARREAKQNEMAINVSHMNPAENGIQIATEKKAVVHSPIVTVKPISDEGHAEFSLETVRALKANRNTNAAWIKCKELIERFPNTKAADQAKALLPSIYD